MTTAVPMAAAVVDRLPQLSGDRELAELARTGPGFLAEVTRYVHGEVERDRLDVEAINGWHSRWLRQSTKVATVAAAGYVGLNVLKISRQVLVGGRAPATLVAVRDTGTTINDDPRVELRFRVEPLGEPAFEATRKLTVSRIDVPRAGTQLDVVFDPADRRHVTFRRADLTAPPTTPSPHGTAGNTASIDQLAQLAELHAAGSLTDSEFACAKASVLGAVAV